VRSPTRSVVKAYDFVITIGVITDACRFSNGYFIKVSSDLESAFSDGGRTVYGTLVVPRNARVLNSGRAANGISGLRERFSFCFFSLGWTVNKSRSCTFK